MISNHTQFIDAIRERNLIRIVFYSKPAAGTVDHECAPLDYGPTPGEKDSLNRYWVWDNSANSGANPLGLAPDQIVSVQVLGNVFSPAQFPVGDRLWSVPRDWVIRAKSPAQQELSKSPTHNE